MLPLLVYPFRLFERLLFVLVVAYDKLVYSPLQTCLSPVVACIPRYANIAGHRVPVFTANVVSLSRTALVVLVAWCLKMGYFSTACLAILFHDFLDHLDGIVAKVQRRLYGPVDDPLLGGFMDAFCDKVVNVLSLWSILLLTSFADFGLYQALAYVGVCCGVIGYEVVLGVVRVQDYFQAHYTKGREGALRPNIAASKEGKLKEKLESLGLALLCLALAAGNPMDTWTGVIGVICLAISLRFAQSSLSHKLSARKLVTVPTSEVTTMYDPMAMKTNQTHHPKRVHFTTSPLSPNPRQAVEQLGTLSMGSLPHVVSAPELKSLGGSDSESTGSEEETAGRGWEKVDKVYTVGCFDLFHRGHVNLLKNMRKMGREIIVGVHNDESYFALKNKVPIDNTEKRMSNVKKYAHQVFVVSSTDPAPYIQCCVHLEPDQQGLYVRGDDMPQFPGRSVCEELMPIKLLPYTKGISSTMLRAQILAQQNRNGTIPVMADAHDKED